MIVSARLARLCSIAVALATGGCLARSEPGVVVRDSAGVTIVDNLRPADPGSITVDSIAVIDIGGEAAGPQYEFVYQLGSALRLNDGRIVASGWAKPEFRIYDSTGKWLKTVGRSGRGPGEFEGLGFVYHGPGNSLITFEPGRLQWFDSTGQFIRFQTPMAPPSQANGWARAVFGDGTMVMWSSLPDPSVSDDRVLRSRDALNRYWPVEQRRDSLVAFLSAPNLRHPDPAYRQSSAGKLLFAPQPSWSALGNRLALTLGERSEFSLYNWSGRLLLQSRFRAAEVPVTAKDREAALESTTRLDSRVRDRVRAGLLELSTFRSKPATESIAIATDGHVWVGYGNRPVDHPAMAVFDPSGRWQTDVEVPPALTIHEIGADYLLCSKADDAGFIHVLLFRVRR